MERGSIAFTVAEPPRTVLCRAGIGFLTVGDAPSLPALDPNRSTAWDASTCETARVTVDDSLRAFIAGLPKAELHVHHVGSASPEIVAELARRHPGRVPTSIDALCEFMTFRDFDHFIQVYLAVAGLVRTPEDVRTLTYEIGRELASTQNVRYVELTCTPHTSVQAGIPIEAYSEAIEDARLAAERDHGIVMRWIYDFNGADGIPAADATLSYALGHRVPGLVGFGIGGPEVGVPRPQFERQFAAARASGLRSVPHAGETTGPETVWDAIRVLGAERIGHGTQTVHDPALVRYLVDHQIPVEACPTSNLATRAVASLEEHPLPALVEAGVLVTINSDDPPMFGTTLNREYEVAADLLGLDREGLARLAVAGVSASFLEDDGKARLIAEIEAYAETSV